MSITIAEEMKQSTYIKLPNLYQNLEILALIDNLFYKAFGSEHEYDFSPQSIEKREKEDASYYIDVDDLCYIEPEGPVLLGNMAVHVFPLTDYELHEFSHTRKTPLYIYQMDMEQLKRTLFITENLNVPISNTINEMFLQSKLPHIYTVKNVRYQFKGLTNDYCK